jgi:hypothetical protein
MTTTTPPATREPELAEVPERLVLAVDGTGGPDGPAFAAAISALYAVPGTDPATPLEGLWSSGAPETFDLDDPAAWRWTLLKDPPEGAVLPAGGPVRLERLAEGRVAQVLHVGPYEAEGPTIARLHAWIAEQGLERHGRHHEIYLDDPRTTPPEELRTVLRHPVRPVR